MIERISMLFFLIFLVVGGVVLQTSCKDFLRIKKTFHPTYFILHNGVGEYNIPLESGRVFRIYNAQNDTWIHIIVPSENMDWYDEYKKKWLEPECQFGCEEIK